MKSDIDSILKAAGLRSTAPRKDVFAILKKATDPLTATEIIRLLPNTDKVSVYRTIDTFLRLGVVTTVPRGWKPYYELAAPLKPHHHHLFCTSCSRLIDIHAPKAEEAISAIAALHQFSAQAHTLEISGICQTCRATSPASQ